MHSKVNGVDGNLRSSQLKEITFKEQFYIFGKYTFFIYVFAVLVSVARGLKSLFCVE